MSDSHFLELSTLAAWGTEKNLGANAVTGIGVISGVECMISAHDPTSQAGSSNRYSLAKTLRAQDIAGRTGYPSSISSSREELTFPIRPRCSSPAASGFAISPRCRGWGFRRSRSSSASSTAGGAYVPAMCDYSVMVKERAKVFLGGPPLVKMATGEESSDEELGGAEMHSRISGLSDYFANDEPDACGSDERSSPISTGASLDTVLRSPAMIRSMTQTRSWGRLGGPSDPFRPAARSSPASSTGRDSRNTRHCTEPRW